MPSLEAYESSDRLASSRPPFDMHSYSRHSYEKNSRNTRSSSCTSTKSNKDGIEGYTDGLTNKGLFQIGYSNTVSNEQSGSIKSENRSSNSSTFSSDATSTSAAEVGWERSPNGSSQVSDTSKNPINSSNGQDQVNNTGSISSMSIINQNSRQTEINSPILLKSNGANSSQPSRLQTLSTPVPCSNYRFSFPVSNTRTTPHTTQQLTNLLQSSSTSELKHRHTLQVPKSVPARSSRDDAPYTSGRFSPSTVNSQPKNSLNPTIKSTQILTHEEVAPDDDALLWAEAVRQKRASKRRKKDDEDEDRVVVGNKVDQNHENWVMAYNMLTGIRFTVSRTNAKIDRPLTIADFEARHKFSFDM